MQIDPYLEDSLCNSCKLQAGPYFCRDLASEKFASDSVLGFGYCLVLQFFLYHLRLACPDEKTKSQIHPCCHCCYCRCRSTRIWRTPSATRVTCKRAPISAAIWLASAIIAVHAGSGSTLWTPSVTTSHSWGTARLPLAKPGTGHIMGKIRGKTTAS